jgi:hypothetical protein
LYTFLLYGALRMICGATVLTKAEWHGILELVQAFVQAGGQAGVIETPTMALDCADNELLHFVLTLQKITCPPRSYIGR